ncbi:hypothetical protein G9A89_002916 [Geosiphon pyriformis]|nr:hypothetical protein G9A89_002916 [Geosiphon pyriformis]
MYKFDGIWIFTTGLDVSFYGAGIAIIMDISLAWHVSKIKEISDYLIFVHLLFKNKLSVTFLGLYAGVLVGTCFGQAADINFMISKAVNSSFFVILGGNFNENRSKRSVSFKFCLSLGLSNSRSVEKVIDFIFVSRNLVFTVVLHKVNNVSEFFDTNHKSVLLSFKNYSSAKLLVRSDIFESTKDNNDLNMMWKIIEKTMYSEYDYSRNKQSSKFFKLELLIAKIMKFRNSGNLPNFDCLVKVRLNINKIETSMVVGIILNGASLMNLVKHLLVVKKKYRKSKYCEFKIAKDMAIRKTIDHCVKSAFLLINNLTISIVKRGETHKYLGIFLSTEDFSKFSLAQAYMDVQFFSNVVLQKVITDKQFLYLILIVLQPIISYRTQFSFISLSMCCKWDLIIRKDLRIKAGLPCDFSSKRLNPRGSVFCWFILTSEFLVGNVSLEVESAVVSDMPVIDILESEVFSEVCGSLLKIWSDCIEIYMDGSLKSTGSAKVVSGAAVYFLAVNMDIGVKVDRLLSSTLTKLQTVALALMYILSSCSVIVYSDSQSVIDACLSETLLAQLHIVNFFKDKDISINWVKVKSHLGVPGNIKADMLEWFLVAENTAIFGNAYHFTSPGYNMVPNILIKEIDWKAIMMKLASIQTYLIKTVYRWLPVVVRKKLYNKGYPGVLCLLCGKIEVSLTSSSCPSSSSILCLLLSYSLDMSLYTAICKGFVLRDWYAEAVLCFKGKGKAVLAIINYVKFVVKLYHAKVWLIRSKHRIDMEKTGLVKNDSLVLDLSLCLVSTLSNEWFATVGSNIIVMKKTIMNSGLLVGFEAVLLRKKRRNSILEDSIGNREASARVLIMVARGNPNQMPKNSRIKTKKALSKPLNKINFSKKNDDDNILIETPLALFPSLKDLVNVLVKKSFAFNIKLDKVIGKIFQEKCVMIRKLFSEINDFRGAFILLKFAGIIRAIFTSELSLAQALDKAKNWAVVLKKIPIETLAKAIYTQKTVIEFEQLDYTNLVTAEWSILIGKDAMYVIRANNDKKSWNIRDSHKMLLYILLVKTNVYDIWDFINLVDRRTCIIDHYLVTYVRARCAVICFGTAELLDTIMGTMLILRSANLCWSCFVSAKYLKCEKSGYTSLECAIGKKIPSGNLPYRVFSEANKSRLATIYAKYLVLVAHSIFFEGADIVMSKSLGAFINGEIIAEVVFLNMSSVSKLENNIKCLMEMVLDLSAKVEHLSVSLVSLLS